MPLQQDWRSFTQARTSQANAIVSSAAHQFLLPKQPSNLSVIAVGGYGRSELFPFSDVDILILLESESVVPGIKEPVALFLRALWDSGFRASHSVRTVQECCRVQEGNTELHISLLDNRLVCGDASLFARLSQGLAQFYERQGAKLAHLLADLTRQRHSKFNHTTYHLEPNIKEVPGGIRDVHFLRWLSMLTGRDNPVTVWANEVEDAKSFLYQVRYFLHLQSERDNNLLSFELQDAAATELPPEPLKPEEWMRIYYKNARLIYQASLRALEYTDSHDPSLLRHFRDWRQRLSTPDFTVSRERVFLRNAGVVLHSPGLVLQLFTFVARHGIQLSWDTQHRLQADLTCITESFHTNPVSWTTWREFFTQPNAALALREMQETGLLASLFGPWRSIDSLVVRDFYHRYTVDEHTFVAIETIDHLIAKKAGVPERFHELAIEEHEPAILRLALLFHDIGKGITPGDHVQGSLQAAREVLLMLGAPEDQIDAVLFLIDHHLDLSSVMNGLDLHDPATARHLTSRVPTQEQLRRLTLLTYADIAAVNPTALTPWRIEQLWRVYSVGLEQLTRELVTDRIPEDVESSASPEMAHFLQGLPSRYLRTHGRSEIEKHLHLWRRSQQDGMAVDIREDAGAYLLTVVARDRPGLFASLCGALASFGMDIVKGEAASNAEGSVLDFIQFTDPMRTLELNPDELKRLQWTMECVTRGSMQVDDLLKRRRAPRRPSSGARIFPRVRFSNDASDLATLIDFVAEDRPGLLYDLASALGAEGCNIDVVMIDTEAHKAIDVFYVTRNGVKLDEPVQDRLRSKFERVAIAAG